MTQKPEEKWIEQFNKEFVSDGMLCGNHLILKDFIRELLASQTTRAVEEERERIKDKIEKHRKSDTYEGEESLVFQTTVAEILDALSPKETKDTT